ncbi:Hypothetical predicted protein [Podarcis lilfordi]|uniref:Uncharacterized protein n=1 Tax=Podarcis lilfordi TaxID=74358 RepID=A0AA35KTH7_9SAUR|nr:Hypothetical predicted protein [Podarcis lilfordi]
MAMRKGAGLRSRGQQVSMESRGKRNLFQRSRWNGKEREKRRKGEEQGQTACAFWLKFFSQSSWREVYILIVSNRHILQRSWTPL